MNIKFTNGIVILLFFLNFSELTAQNFSLSVRAKKNENKSVFEELSFLKIHSSEESISNEIKSIQSKLEKKGYLNTSLDSLYIIDSIYNVQFTLRKPTKNLRIYYFTESLHYKFDPGDLLSHIALEITKNYVEIPFTEIEKTMQLIVDYYEKNGNSFVQVSVDHIYLEDEIAIAQLNLVLSRKRNIDKIVVKGYTNFPKSFIKHNLNLKNHNTFNKEKLANISLAINNLSFVEEQKPPEILFTNDSTHIYLYLKKKNANRFDGVIGFSSKEESDGLEFNGYLDFLFNNIFNSGESIAILWKNNGKDSQRFFISAETPYIFGLPIIPKAKFEIFRQDSSFNTIRSNFDISYVFRKSKITATYHSENSNNLLSSNLISGSITSFKSNFFGGQYQYSELNNDILFTEKLNLSAGAYFGNRKVTDLKTSQTQLTAQLNYLITINNKNYFYIQNQSAILISENFLDNELFRIGGVNSIRGFNEESILVSSYSVFNFEYRFRPSISTYIFPLLDFAFVQNKISNINSTIFSLGVGYAFNTKIGILNLSYAIGKFDDSPFNLDDSTLHIKIVSIF